MTLLYFFTELLLELSFYSYPINKNYAIAINHMRNTILMLMNANNIKKETIVDVVGMEPR